MNRYGARAQAHWQKWMPSRYQELQDPEMYFVILGEEIEARIDEVSTALAGEDPPEESYLQKLGRLNMARLDAEAQVLRELAFLEPEQQT